jgi:hypothetical protein
MVLHVHPKLFRLKLSETFFQMVERQPSNIRLLLVALEIVPILQILAERLLTTGPVITELHAILTSHRGPPRGLEELFRMVALQLFGLFTEMNTKTPNYSVENLDQVNLPTFWGAPPNWGGGWSGSGILGTYYSNSNYTGTSFQRTDVRIDMPPTTVLPGGSLSTDPVYGAVGSVNFSVKWLGNLVPKYTGTYTLKLRTGGTLTLKIGGATVATATVSADWVYASYSFTAGVTYAIEVDMVQGTGSWCAQVRWLGVGSIVFPEEAIGPATPIAANNEDDLGAPANGAICCSAYQGPSFSGTGPALDSSGWPMGDFALNQMSIPSYGSGPYSFPNVGYASDGRAGVWSISFNGAAQISSNGPNNPQFLIGYNDGNSRTQVTLNGQTYYSYGQTLPAASLGYDLATGTGYHASSNSTFVLFDNRVSSWDNIGFVNTDRSGKGAPDGPPGAPAQNGLTNIACMRPSAVGSSHPLPLGTVFSPPYLASLSPYTCTRNNGDAFNIDFIASVTSPYTDWSNRTTPNFNVFATCKSQYISQPVLPLEYKIMAANQAGKDLYINLPQTASGNASDSDYTSSYIYRLANLIKSGSTFNGVNYPGLLPHLSVYIEYGNENWNWSSYSSAGTWYHNVVNAANANKQANTNDWRQFQAMGGGVVINSSGVVTDVHTIEWGVIKVKDASDLFRMVFGDSAMPGGPAGWNPDPRIRPILEWQYGGSPDDGGTGDAAFRMVASYFGIIINHVFWGGGGGWYSDYNPSGSTADDVFSNITLATGGLPSGGGAGETNSIQQDVDRLAQLGLHHVGYEGGFDFGTTDGEQQASNDSRIIPYVQQTLNQYFQAGGSLPIVFMATGGAYGFSDRWATIDGIWDEPPYAPAPPKLQGYLDSEANLPAPVAAPAAWPVAPAHFPVQWGRQTSRPPQYQTFVVSTPGIYSVGFATNPNYPGPTTGNIVASLDGSAFINVVTTNPNIAQAYWSLVYLGAGVHVLEIAVLSFSDPSKQITFDPWGATNIPGPPETKLKTFNGLWLN